MPEEYKRFGGGLSVRKKENVRPIIPIGQDECTFHEFTFAKKYWKDPMGENILFPKSMGEMYMISGYQAREFGLGLGYLYTKQVEEKVNKEREEKSHLLEEDSKIERANNAKKDKLTCDPTLQFFQSGANHWNSSHNKLQLEDVSDVLPIIFPDHNFVFLFHQSSGHTKMRESGLTTTKNECKLWWCHPNHAIYHHSRSRKLPSTAFHW